LAIGFDVLVQPQAGCPLQQRREGGLADVERFASQVVAVEFDQIEGIQEDARVMTAIAQAVEVRHALVVAAHRLAVVDAGARAQPR
jgi:hypothetical protein